MEKHLQKKWQREGNPALRSRLNQVIYTSAVVGECHQWGLVGSSPRESLSKSLQTERHLRVYQNMLFFFPSMETISFQKVTF